MKSIFSIALVLTVNSAFGGTPIESQLSVVKQTVVSPQGFHFTLMGIDQKGGKYISEDDQGVVWGPIEANSAGQVDALKLCESKRELGLIWSLPTPGDLTTLNNPSAQGYRYNRFWGEIFSNKNDGLYWAKNETAANVASQYGPTYYIDQNSAVIGVYALTDERGKVIGYSGGKGCLVSHSHRIRCVAKRLN